MSTIVEITTKSQSISTITSSKYLFVLTLQIKLATESQNIWIWFNGRASGFSFCDCEGLPPGHSLPHLFIFNIKFMAILYVDYRNVLSYFVRPQININDRIKFNSACVRTFECVFGNYTSYFAIFSFILLGWAKYVSRVRWRFMKVGALFLRTVKFWKYR